MQISDTFDTILSDYFSLIKILQTTLFDDDCYMFTIDFKKLYLNIVVKDKIEVSQEPFFQNPTLGPKCQLIASMAMGLNLAHVLSNMFWSF